MRRTNEPGNSGGLNQTIIVRRSFLTILKTHTYTHSLSLSLSLSLPLQTVNEKDVHVHTLSTKSGSDVWRLGWNETGTVLATSGEGGSVNMWKASFEGEWKCVEEV